MRDANKTDIVVVSHGFQSHYELGFVNGLAEAGCSVLLLGSDTTLADRLDRRVTLLNIRGSQDSKRTALSKAYGMARYHAKLMWELWRRRGSHVVIIGLLTPEWFVGLIELWLIRKMVRSLALVVHNVLPHNRGDADARRVYEKIYRLPHHFLVHAESTRHELVRQFGLRAQDILLTPHGLNTAIVPAFATKAEAKAALGLPDSARTVLMFGVASHYKGTDLLLDAMQRLPSLHLLMAGRCPRNEFGDAMARQVGELVKLGQATWINEFVSDELTGTLFRAADVCVLPYRQIDQSGVLVLALTLGVPVLVSEVGGFAEFVSESNGSFFPRLDAEALCEALDDFFANRLVTLDPQRVRRTVEHLEWHTTLRPYAERVAGRH